MVPFMVEVGDQMIRSLQQKIEVSGGRGINLIFLRKRVNDELTSDREWKTVLHRLQGK